MNKISARRTKPQTAIDPDLVHRNLATAVIAFHEVAARKSGLGISEHKCLGVLGLTGPATAGQLARESGFTTGAITGIVDRLEKAGLVRREPNPQDRRSVIIRPLVPDKRARQAGTLFRSLTESMAKLRADYTQAELDTIFGYLLRTTEILKQEALKLDG
jgi:DNA-binding MarR family transcriptional regulator